MRVFVDTNIWLDIALTREGFSPTSGRALAKCQEDGHAVFVAWHSVATIFYLLQKSQGGGVARRFVEELLVHCTVATTGHEAALQALAYPLRDFEDALQLSAAVSVNADIILTRDQVGFDHPAGPAVLSPAEFLIRG